MRSRNSRASTCSFSSQNSRGTFGRNRACVQLWTKSNKCLAGKESELDEGGKKEEEEETDESETEDDDDDDSEYEVEEIRGKREKETKKGKVIEYCIKWVGWKECTWEPLANLSGCTELVAQYDKKHNRFMKLQAKAQKMRMYTGTRDPFASIVLLPFFIFFHFHLFLSIRFSFGRMYAGIGKGQHSTGSMGFSMQVAIFQCRRERIFWIRSFANTCAQIPSAFLCYFFPPTFFLTYFHFTLIVQGWGQEQNETGSKEKA